MSDSDRPIFYRSSGLIVGTYLPSEDDLSHGILITEQGLFPATVNEQILRFLTRNPKKKTIKRKHPFICFVAGLTEPPYYQFYLIGRKGKRTKNKLFRRPNRFLTQGIVTQRSPEKVILRVQKNPTPERTSQEIEESINYVEIRGCPGLVRSSQFWLLRSNLKEDGFLHYHSGELLAKAKVAKSYLKIP